MDNNNKKKDHEEHLRTIDELHRALETLNNVAGIQAQPSHSPARNVEIKRIVAHDSNTKPLEIPAARPETIIVPPRASAIPDLLDAASIHQWMGLVQSMDKETKHTAPMDEDKSSNNYAPPAAPLVMTNQPHVDHLASTVFHALLKAKSPAFTHTASFDGFLEYGIQEVVSSLPILCYNNDHESEFELLSFEVERPTHTDRYGKPHALFPIEARRKELEYTSRVWARVRQGNVERKTSFGRLPIMVQSKRCQLYGMSREQQVQHGECEYDLGGYFITRGGKAKVLVHREYRPFNQVLLVRESKPVTVAATVLSRPQEGGNPLQRVRELRVLIHPASGIVQVSLRPPQSHPFRPPITLVFRAYNLTDMDEIRIVLKFAAPFPVMTEVEEMLRDTLEADAKMTIPGSELVAVDGLTQDQAIEALVRPPYNIVQIQKVDPEIQERGNEQEIREEEAKNLRAACNSAKKFLQFKVLPHIGRDDSNETRLRKCCYLAYMWHRVALVECNRAEIDNIDSLTNKMVATSGELMTLLWSRCVTLAWDEARRKSLENPTIEAALAGCCDRLSNNLLTALTTGNFPPWYTGTKAQTGCIQPLEMANRHEYLKLMSRVHNPIQTWNASSAMEVDNTQFGIYCPSSGRDDMRCGLEKEQAVLAHITSYVPVSEMKRVRQFVLAQDGVLRIPSALRTNNGSADLIVPLDPKDKSPEAKERVGLVRGFRILLNDVPLALIHHPVQLMTAVQQARQLGQQIPRSVSIAIDEAMHVIHIRIQSGQHRRAVLVCNPETNQPILDQKSLGEICQRLPEQEWAAAMEKLGWIDYVSAQETWSSRGFSLGPAPNSSLSGQLKRKRLTHAEVTTESIFGPSVACMTSVQHQNATRVSLSVQQIKSAIGSAPGLNYQLLLSQKSHVLRSGQRPLHCSPAALALDVHTMPIGSNAVVFVMEYKGFITEDPMYMNKSSLDRGMGASDIYRPYRAVIHLQPMKKNEKVFETLENPALCEKCSGIDSLDYSCLPKVPTCVCGCQDAANPNHKRNRRCCYIPTTGIAPVRTLVKPGQVVIGVTQTIVSADGRQRKTDMSTIVKSRDYGQIVAVSVEATDERIVVQMQIVTHYPVWIGQKFTNSCGQKGKVDMVETQENMPFTEDGIVPDIIFNEHGIPGRGTIGMLEEMRLQKTLAIDPSCDVADHLNDTQGDPHRYCRTHTQLLVPTDSQGICERLRQAGFQDRGEEALRCPETGRLLPGRVFTGIIPYWKLPHTAEAKMHGRPKDGGPRFMGSNQPISGRTNEGGYRFDELLRLCIMMWGASEQSMEWNLRNSDGMKIYVCGRCGLMCVEIKEAGKTQSCHCNVCGEKGKCEPVYMPGGLKAICQTLLTAGMALRLFPEDDPDPDDADLYTWKAEQQLSRRHEPDVFASIRHAPVPDVPTFSRM